MAAVLPLTNELVTDSEATSPDGSILPAEGIQWNFLTGYSVAAEIP